MNEVTMNEIFTLAELAKAERIIATTRGGTDRITRLASEITIPALPRINDRTGQENDARYFAYLLESFFCERVVKATRQLYICDQCQQYIQVGSQCMYVTGVDSYNHDFYYLRAHEQCYHAWIFMNDNHAVDDEWQMLDEALEECDSIERLTFVRDNWPEVAETFNLYARCVAWIMANGFE